ncbi:MAG: proline--tRNA ligase [Candidatus Dormiibacterota bacterium]
MTEDLTFVKELTRMSVDFDRWYTEVVRKAELADYTPVRGCMVIRPYGYAIWEAIQRAFDDLIKSSGHENWYFPLLIPEELLVQEAEHVEGFVPEVAWVTEAGSHGKLDQRLAIRPTSETIIGTLVRRYIQSYRDLPILTNQWANVLRWELRTRLFLRTAEFLWQEGHTFHVTAQEAEDEVALIHEYYRQIAEDWLAMPVIGGTKSPAETFPGAVYSKSIEAMMRDGLALQAGTSHYLGQNFARAYDIGFANQQNARDFCHTTSWGISTRLIGGLIMAHGDDTGLVMPPRVAPIQVVVVPIARNDEARAEVRAFVDGWLPEVRGAGLRVHVDWRDLRPGDKYNHWELKGVPLRLDVGLRDVAAQQVVLVDRLTREKVPTPVTGLASRLREAVDAFQRALFSRALDFRAENTFEVSTLDALLEHFRERNGFVWAPWCGDAACEAKVKELTGGVTTRNFDPDEKASGACVVCGRPAVQRVVFARAY